MYASNERMSRPHVKLITIGLAAAIVTVLLLFVLFCPAFARLARADELRHAECPSSPQQSVTASVPDIGMMSGMEGIEPLRHNDDCPH